MKPCSDHCSQYSNVDPGGIGTPDWTRSNYLMTSVELLENVSHGWDSESKHNQGVAAEVTASILPLQKIIQIGLLGTNMPDWRALDLFQVLPIYRGQ